MKIKFLSALTGALTLMSMASCSSTSIDNGGDQKPVYYLTAAEDANFVAVNEYTSTGAWNTYRGVKYVIIYDENDNTATLSISDLQYGPKDTDRLTMTLAYMAQSKFTDPNVKGAIYEGTVTLGSGSTQGARIGDIRVSTLLDTARTFGTKENGNGNAEPAEVGAQTFISFTINDKYKVRIIQKDNYFYGQTSSICTNGQFTPFTTQKAKYRVSFHQASKTANITIENAQFLSNMPSGITMSFPGVKFDINNDGITLNSPGLIPTYNNIPMDAYEVTGLTGTILNEDRLQMNFTCPHVPIPMNSDTNYSFDVSVNAPYSLSVR